MIEMHPEQLEGIRRIAEEAYPHECCGILVGSHLNGKTQVTEWVAAENQRRDSPANRYLISPELVRQVERRFRGTGQEIVGFFHSHPDVPARPSQYDRDHAWPWYTYLIVSVREGRSAEALAWRLKEDRSDFEPEEVRESPVAG